MGAGVFRFSTCTRPRNAVEKTAEPEHSQRDHKEGGLMSNEVSAATNAGAESWPALNSMERRLLGVLVEKAKTTPDTYPLSLNALTTGCNQKSARDPVMNLSEDDVLETLSAMQGKGLVTRIQGGRVERYRHNLYDFWRVNKVELATLAELLLRGPQTEGELRGRATRMEPIEDVEALRGVLRPLAQRNLVVFLGVEGRRGTLITHGFHDPRELGALKSRQQSEYAAEETRAREPAPAVSRGTDSPSQREEIAALRQQVAALEEKMATLLDEVNGIKSSLGIA